MTALRRCMTFPSIARCLAALCATASMGAHAVQYELTFTGTFNSLDAINLASASSLSFFAGTTPFTINSFFDDSTPNLLPTTSVPFSGFRAYSPSLTLITIGSSTYTVDPASVNAAAGVAVAIFDTSQIFTPGRYGIGLIANPAGDGAGIVGDFSSASPAFSTSAIVPTTFTNYFGVGVGSGVCLSGSPPNCPHAVTPWVLHDSASLTYSLTLGNYEEDYPVAHTPNAVVGPLNTAMISAVPEPSTNAMLLAGLVGVAWVVRRRSSGARSAGR